MPWAGSHARLALAMATRYWFSVATLALGALLHLAALDTIPAGLHTDEAFHLLRAQDILSGADLPRYITGNQGNEPLFAYLAAGVIAIVGPVPWAGRLVSAFASLVALAATIRIGRALAPGRWVGVAAGLAWGTLGMALTVGRLGTQPMLSVMAAALAVAGLTAGLRSGRWQDYALGGLGLGLGLDAYVAFRLFPLVPVVFGAHALLRKAGAERRTVIHGGWVFVGVAALVYAPVASFFIQHPEWFFNRFGQVTGSTLGATGGLGAVIDGAAKTLGGLFWGGDLNVRHNLPGRPVLDIAQSIVLGIGLVALARRWRTPEAIGLMVWLVVGLAPGVLTDSAPHFLRIATAGPALALIMAFGAEAVSRFRPWGAGGLAFAWLGSSTITVWLVFTQWTSGYEANYLFDQPSRWIAERLRTAPSGTRLFLSPIPRENYTIEYLLGPDRYADLASFNGRECTVLPELTQADRPLVAVISGEDPLTPQTLREAFPGTRVAAENVWIGTAQATVYQLPAAEKSVIAPEHPLHDRFGSGLELLGWDGVDLALTPGGVLRFNTHWRVTTTTDATWVTFAHLRGVLRADGSVVYAQRDSEPCDESYPTPRWRVGERVIERTHIDLPLDLPAGEYALYIGWYDRTTLARLPVLDPSGDTIGDEVLLTLVNAP